MQGFSVSRFVQRVCKLSKRKELLQRMKDASDERAWRELLV
jgi:hypothetical protein